MPRSTCSPSGTSGVMVSAATAPEISTRLAERPAQPLQPADQVDREAGGGEVQPVGRPDIAPQYLAQLPPASAARLPGF
jgi:hypothetical protein